MVWESATASSFLSHRCVSPFKQNRASSGLPSFLPLSSICVIMDGRRSPCHSIWKPHSELALQLLQGSTVWSCPVWLQTKHRGTHNLKPPDRDACNTNIFCNGRRRRTQTFHILCESLMSTESFQSVYFMSAPFSSLLCICVFFLSNFRTPSSSLLWQMFRRSACGYERYVHDVHSEYTVYSSSGVRVMQKAHLTGIRCQLELPTASASSFCSPTAVKILNTMKGFQLAPSL